MVAAVAPLSVYSAPGPVMKTEIVNVSDGVPAEFNNVTGEIRLLGIETELVSEDEPAGAIPKLQVLSDTAVKPVTNAPNKTVVVVTTTVAPVVVKTEQKNNTAAHQSGASSLLINNSLLIIAVACLGMRAAFDKTIAL